MSELFSRGEAQSQAPPALAAIRPARRDDLLEVAALDTGVFFDQAATIGQWRDYFLRGSHAIHVAQHGGNVVGFSLLRLRRDRVSIEGLAVASRLRRRGVGRQLIFAAVAEAAGNLIVAELSERNLTGQVFLRSLGFRAVKFVPDVHGGDGGLIFERRPSPPPPPPYPAPAEFYRRPIVP